MPEFLKRMPPGQRNAVIAVAIGALLGVFALVRKNGGAATSGTLSNSDTPAGSGASTAYPSGSTFADNGAALGELNTTLTGTVGLLQNVLDAMSPQTTETGVASTPTTPPAAATNITLNIPSSYTPTPAPAAAQVFTTPASMQQAQQQANQQVANSKSADAQKAAAANAKKPANASKGVFVPGKAGNINWSGK